MGVPARGYAAHRVCCVERVGPVGRRDAEHHRQDGGELVLADPGGRTFERRRSLLLVLVGGSGIGTDRPRADRLETKSRQVVLQSRGLMQRQQQGEHIGSDNTASAVPISLIMPVELRCILPSRACLARARRRRKDDDVASLPACELLARRRGMNYLQNP